MTIIECEWCSCCPCECSKNEDMSTCDRCNSEFYFEDLIWEQDLDETGERLTELFGKDSTFEIDKPQTSLEKAFFSKSGASRGYSALCSTCLEVVAK